MSSTSRFDIKIDQDPDRMVPPMYRSADAYRSLHIDRSRELNLYIGGLFSNQSNWDNEGYLEIYRFTQIDLG